MAKKEAILAISKDSKAYLVGECKFKKTAFRYSEYLDTKAKLKPQQENADFYYALFSESGFDDKVLAESKSDPKLALHSLEDIVGLV